MNSFHLLDNLTLADCNDCPFKGSQPVFSYFISDEETKNIDVLILGQSPGQSEIEQGRPFIGKSGQLINSIINKYTNKIGYVNALLCRPINDRMPETLELKCCRERMLEDVRFAIENLNPKIMLVLGGSAKKQLKYLQKNIPKINEIVTYQFEHPAYILRNDYMMPQYVNLLHGALKSVFNEQKNISENFIFYSDKHKFQFLNDTSKTTLAGVDIETNGLNIFAKDFKIGTVAISCDEFTYFFDFRESDIKKCEILIEFLRNEKIQKVFADVLFDVIAFRKFDIEINNITDLFPVAFLYDNTHREYSLEAICLRYKPEFAAYKSKFKFNLIDNDYLKVDTSVLFAYNSTDALVTRLLYNDLYSKLEINTKKIYEIIYRKLLEILVNVKITGLRIDVELLKEYEELYKKRFLEISKIFNDKYQVTNINSPPQIRKWMFEQLKLKPIRKTENDNDSTDKKTIEYYAEKAPEVKLLLEARVVSSRLNYFLSSINDNLDDNNMIHANYKHYGIQSGRISCRNPNLQGIPRDKTDMKSLDDTPLRKIFVSRYDDSYIIEFDYSQQEVRIVAFLAQDSNMIQAFNDGKDIHRYVASIIFRKKYDEISLFERQVAKGCVFGAIFGVSAKELATTLKTDEKTAQSHIDKFFNEFPRIKHYIDSQGDMAVRNKKIISVLGMPRSFIVNRLTINDVRRESANHQIQSVGAAFTFLSLIRIYEFLKKSNLLDSEVFIIHTVHDSIMLDVKKQHLEFVINNIVEIMENVPKSCKFTIAYPVECKIGKFWGDDIKLETLTN